MEGVGHGGDGGEAATSAPRRVAPPLFVAGALAAGFAALALLAVFAEPLLLRLDAPVRDRLFDLRVGWAERAMIAVSFLGSRWVIGGVLAAIAVWVLLGRGSSRLLVVLVAAFAVAGGVEFLMKAVVGRPRPDLLPLLTGKSSAFPSGHVLGSMSFYGVLALSAWRSSAATRRSILAVGGAAVLLLAVGFSRMYVGAHWMTDTFGGYLLGGVVLAVAAMALGSSRLSAQPAGHPPQSIPDDGRPGISPDRQATSGAGVS